MHKTSLSILSATTGFALISAPIVSAEEATLPLFEVTQEQNNTVATDVYTGFGAYSPEVSSVATALGNIAEGRSDSGSIDTDIYQTLNGAVLATNTIEGGIADSLTATTTAYGNSASGGTSQGSNFYFAEQTSNGYVEAHTNIQANTVSMLASSTTAIANVSAPSSSQGETRGYQKQESFEAVTAITEADLCCASYSGVLATTAGGNAVSSESSGSTSINGAVQITSQGKAIRATSDIDIANGHIVNIATTAYGNSATVNNQWGYATLGRDVSPVYQENSSDIIAETEVNLDHWTGSGAIAAYAMGNTALINNSGGDTGLFVNQNNSGGILASLDLTGQTWTGGAATATAIGNAATASLCNTCGDAVLFGSVNQINNGSVTAKAHVTAAHSSGKIHVAGTAIGNSATFTSSSP